MPFSKLKKIIDTNKWFIVPAIIVLYVSAATLMLVGLVRLYFVIIQVINSIYYPSRLNSMLISADFIGIIDIYILGLVFYILAISIYKLFIGNSITLSWIKVDNIHDLKSQLAKMSVLFLCTMMVQKITEWQNAIDTMYFCISIVLTSAILIWFSSHLDSKTRNEKNDDENSDCK